MVRVKRVLEFQRILARLKCSPQMTGQIGLQVFQPSYLHTTVLYMDQPLRDKLLKAAFGSSEKP